MIIVTFIVTSLLVFAKLNGLGRDWNDGFDIFILIINIANFFD